MTTCKAHITAENLKNALAVLNNYRQESATQIPTAQAKTAVQDSCIEMKGNIPWLLSSKQHSVDIEY